jgi:hypothetical protein
MGGSVKPSSMRPASWICLKRNSGSGDKKAAPFLKTSEVLETPEVLDINRIGFLELLGYPT